MAETTTGAPMRNITYVRVAAIALPIVLSNATVPLQGAIDTAIIGNLGDATLLAAVALGATVISLLFTSFNFLQMGVSGLTAQAIGAGDPVRAVDTLLRAFVIAGCIALLLILLQLPLGRGALMLFEGSPEAEAEALGYFRIRVWGAPAELANYALFGWFAGQERTRRLFEMQLLISVVNVILNATFAIGLGWGLEGVALGTALAAWTGLGYGLWCARARGRAILPAGWRPKRARLLHPAELRAVMSLNRDIFIRTVLLMISFAWITRLGSTQGDVVLAANGVLLEFFMVTAAGLDGFAIAAETLVGQAKGARSRARLRRAVIVSTGAALVLATIFSLVLTLLAEPIIRGFTNVETVREAAYAYVLWASLIPLAGVLAFQFDGVFIGASEGAAMRNAMIVAAGIFLPGSWLLTQAFGNHGIWAGLWLLLAARAATLALVYPRLEAKVEAG